MPSLVRFPRLRAALVVVGLLAGGAAPGAAQAQENLLHGPHPFLKDNELDAHVLVATGLGDSMGGAKLAVDYGYKLWGGIVPFGLDLAINVQHATCADMQPSAACRIDTGTLFETLAGVKWKFATPIPLVPYMVTQAGLAFSFPNGADAAAGFMVRAVGGANYFFFDWFGLGAQVGFSLGSLDYDASFSGRHTYAVFDLGGGVEFQF
jgi:hypothetical protein